MSGILKGMNLDRRTTMRNILLGIIAINLTFISANLALRSVEPVQASDHVQKVAVCTIDGSRCFRPNSLGVGADALIVKAFTVDAADW